MSMCPKCNNQVNEGDKFCEYCGTPVQETIQEQYFCDNCGAKLDSGFEFCQNCGKKIEGSKPNNKQKQKQSTSKKWIPISAIGIVAILVLLSVVLLVNKSSSSKEYALYLQDKEMFYNGLSKNKAWQVTSNLVVDSSELNFTDFSDVEKKKAFFDAYATMTKDNKRLFFVDKIDGYNFSLFYRSINKPKEDAVKIDSDIDMYSVNEDGNKVTYLKGVYSDVHELYQHNLKDKEKIDSHVRTYMVSDDGKKIVYLTGEDELYLKVEGRDKEKIANDVMDYTTEDFNTVYYWKDDTLYKKVVGQDSVKIASDIYDVIKIYDSGEIYYRKEKMETVSLIDYIEDDMKASDEALKTPEKPSYPSRNNYATTQEFEQAKQTYEADYTAYIENYEKYYEKVERDELREVLESSTDTITTYSLCYYNGKEEIVIEEDLKWDSSPVAAEDVAVIAYTANQPMKKLKISEITSVNDVKSQMETLSSTIHFIANKDVINTLEEDDYISSLEISSNGKEIFYIANANSDYNNYYYGDLYRVQLNGDKIQEPELYDTDVYISGKIFIEETGSILYYKDVTENTGDLYVDKKLVDYDVNMENTLYRSNLDKVVYMIDWNEEKQSGMLKVYEHGKTETVAEDVHSYAITSDNNLLYLNDYSYNYYRGTLYRYAGKKPEKVAEDVSCIIEISEEKYRGDWGNYVW